MVEIPDDDEITLLAGRRPSLIGILAIEIGSARRAQELVAMALHGDGVEVALRDALTRARIVGVDLTATDLAGVVRRHLLRGVA